MSRERPRRLGEGLAELVSERTPRTLLGRAQSAWPAVCGEAIAANAEPVSEREGVVTVACSSGAWAQELEMMSDVLVERLGASVGEGAVRQLRFTADLARHR